MEAILPDLNTGYITYRKEIIMNFKSKKYILCFGGLQSLNGMLPDEFQITISDPLYKESIKQTVYAKCNHCTSEYKTPDNKQDERPTEIEFKKVRIYHILHNSTLALLTGKATSERWDCPKCKKSNRLDQTKFVKDIKRKPFYLKVVPEPPQRKDGLMDRTTYHKKVQIYILTFLSEIEHQMGEYRRKYKPKDQSYDVDEFNTNETLDDLL